MEAKMLLNRRNALAGLGALASAPAFGSEPVSGLTVFEARSIITMDPAMPRARYVAVADGLIMGTARNRAELDQLALGRPVAFYRRFAGQVLMPGLIDPHVHPMQAAVMLNLPFVAPEDWDLPSGFYRGAQSPAAWHRRMDEELARSSADPFVCWGHHELFHGPIDRAGLDRIAPTRAVAVWQRSFHEIIVNSAMLRLWGLDTPDAFAAALNEAGVTPADASLAGGIFSENGLRIALDKLRPVLLTPARMQSGFAAMQRLMLRSGVTTISDMGTGIFASFDVEAGLIRAAFERPENPSRAMLMPIAGNVSADSDLDSWHTDLVTRFASPRVRLDRRIKMLVDGAFFAQNMQMAPPGYTDGHIGKWLTPPVAANAQFQRFWDAGFSLHIHVNGDQGLEEVLNGLAMLGPPRSGQTITLEHLGFSTEAQNQRIARMGLMVSAQPNYIRVLGDVYAQHGLGPGRAYMMNRLGSLERKGVTLGLHSDFNMAPIDPLYLAWIATNRETIGGHVRGRGERLSLHKALRAITIDAAKVIGMDGLVGSITPGKRADFTALSADPYRLGATRLREAQVLGVVFEGSVTMV
jgi:predicted amidohydrolase YtcJ